VSGDSAVKSFTGDDRRIH